MNVKQKRLFKLVLTAILCAVSVVLSRFFSFNVWNMSIGVAFLPVMLCSLICGPLWGGVCGSLADLIGALLFPFGTYFPGFTAVAFLSGVIFGLIGPTDRKTQNPVVQISLLAVIILAKELICTLALNTLWISVLYGTDYETMLVTRVPLAAAMFVIQTVSALIICKFILPIIRKVLK